VDEAAAAAQFELCDDPDQPGWTIWRLRDAANYGASLGPLSVRVDNGAARVRMTPRLGHGNLHGALHGGVALGFIDIALFAAGYALGAGGVANGVTVDLATQFISAGRLDRMLEARIELLRETGRLLFLRGLLMQDGEPVVASFTGTLRKGATG
jgi:acyl-coenzyme A thioesterase PaaI-like protein